MTGAGGPKIFGTARFRVPPENADRALARIRTFVEHVRTEEGTERHQAFRDRDDPTRFVHWMVFSDAKAERVHGSSQAVGRFTDELYPLSDGPVGFERYELIAGSDPPASTR
jgi:quinol monooxygenase YgiN